MALFTYQQLHHPVNNRRHTSLLFREFNRENPILSFESEDRDGILSLPQLYKDLAFDDPTEIFFAEEVFGDYDHWKLIAETSLLSDHISKMRDHMTLRRRAHAHRLIVSEITTRGRSSVAAAKFLLTNPSELMPAELVDTGKVKVDGRASRKNQRQSAAEVEATNRANEDLERLRAAGLMN